MLVIICILDDCLDVMSPVQELVTLLAEIGDLYERKKLVNETDAASKCAMLRAWSTVMKRKDGLCVLSADSLDGILTDLSPALLKNWMSIQFDDSVDAVFAKGSNIISTVHLHELQGEFGRVIDGIRRNECEANGRLKRLVELLTRMRSIENKLESQSENVLDYKELRRVNARASLELTGLQEEIGKISKDIGNVPSAKLLHNVCKDLLTIQQRLALDNAPIGGIGHTGMSRCTRLELVDLLGRLNIGALAVPLTQVKPTQYSMKSEHVLWDGNDRVQDKFYVILRRFNGEIIGNHVALGNEDVREFSDGECRNYRLPSGTCGGEHLVVYLYNPAVNKNGVLSLTVKRTDRQSRGSPTAACVEPDTCVVLCIFPVASMQQGHVTVLSVGSQPYRVTLSIAFPRR